MADVVLKDLTKVYEGEKKAVDNISFKIPDKEFVVLVGPSGCGKTTTLRMIAGLEDITDGEILIDDNVVNNVLPKDRDIAMVFQNYALYPHMTVYENMAFGLKLRKFKKEEIDRRVQDAAKILELTELLERKPKALSGGQRQRVAVGRAIVRNPKVFLFDEPLSNLDAKLRVQMRTEISKLHKRLDATIVYVTHDQTEAMTMGDRIVVMHDGHVQQIDAPLDIYNKPNNKFVAGFIGSPAMNFIDGKIESNSKLQFVSEKNELVIDLSDERFKYLNEKINQRIILGVRPEDIHDKSSEVNSITAPIDVVEPMGNETMIYFNVDGKQIISRVNTQYSSDYNNSIELFFDNTKIHFFDAKTEERIISKL